jgi:hypothetical protein
MYSFCTATLEAVIEGMFDSCAALLEEAATEGMFNSFAATWKK